MRSLFRTTTVAFVFAAALLLALPAHAAPVHRTHATPPAASLAAGWSALWTGLTHLLAPVVSPPAGDHKGLSAEGGSCIDPNGGCSAPAQLFRH